MSLNIKKRESKIMKLDSVHLFDPNAKTTTRSEESNPYKTINDNSQEYSPDMTQQHFPGHSIQQ
jgi:hypothetical protein